MKKIRFAMVSMYLTLAWIGWVAADSDDMPQQQEPGVKTPEAVEQPMKADEPMQGGMMKEGMMKKDMKKSAEQKGKELEEQLKQEEQSMPGQ